MDWNRIEGNWKQLKGRAKEKWGRLTDDDLDVVNGRRDQLEGKIQERYGLAKDRTTMRDKESPGRAGALVSVRKHFESFESFVIQTGELIREGHHRCGRRRTADVTIAANCDIRVT